MEGHDDLLSLGMMLERNVELSNEQKKMAIIAFNNHRLK